MTTTTKTKRLDELHFEHQLWTSETKFYADELKIYQNRLAEVAAKNTKEDFRKQVEHFQNQFIIQKEQLDIINHNTKEHEQFLAKFANEHPTAVDHKLFADHGMMEENIKTFRKLYAELKAKFNRFLSVWM